MQKPEIVKPPWASLKHILSSNNNRFTPKYIDIFINNDLSKCLKQFNIIQFHYVIHFSGGGESKVFIKIVDLLIFQKNFYSALWHNRSLYCFLRGFGTLFRIPTSISSIKLIMSDFVKNSEAHYIAQLWSLNQTWLLLFI